MQSCYGMTLVYDLSVGVSLHTNCVADCMLHYDIAMRLLEQQIPPGWHQQRAAEALSVPRLALVSVEVSANLQTRPQARQPAALMCCIPLLCRGWLPAMSLGRSV